MRLSLLDKTLQIRRRECREFVLCIPGNSERGARDSLSRVLDGTALRRSVNSESNTLGCRRLERRLNEPHLLEEKPLDPHGQVAQGIHQISVRIPDVAFLRELARGEACPIQPFLDRGSLGHQELGPSPETPSKTRMLASTWHKGLAKRRGRGRAILGPHRVSRPRACFPRPNSDLSHRSARRRMISAVQASVPS